MTRTGHDSAKRVQKNKIKKGTVARVAGAHGGPRGERAAGAARASGRGGGGVLPLPARVWRGEGGAGARPLNSFIRMKIRKTLFSNAQRFYSYLAAFRRVYCVEY